MGLFDWLGPLGFGGSPKRAAWDLAPLDRQPTAQVVDVKSIPLSLPNAALTVRTLVHGPGAGAFIYGTGNGNGNSAVAACLAAIATAISEPELSVYDTRGGDRVEIEDSALGALLARPNPYMSLDTLLAYISDCLHVYGNAYWRKLRAGDPERGNVVELWPISPSMLSPYSDPSTDDFISYYRYNSSAGYEEISASNIVHFRYGIDDADHRLGYAPVRRLVSEISADAQATRYAERLLANLAINGLTLTFDKDSPPIDQDAADGLKARIVAAYGGDNVGSVSVLSPGATLTALGFSPEQMDLKELHRFPEERVSAVLGVPAIVAGLGVGLDHATYANYAQAREAFTETKLLPLWASLASELTTQLVPDFTSDPNVVVAFDTDSLRALASDANADAVRLKTLVDAGILSADEARAEIGYEPSPVALRPAPTALPVAASARLVERLDFPKRARNGKLEEKAAEHLPDRYETLRGESLPDWEAEILTFLRSQERRVLRRLRAGADTAHDLVPEGEAILLGETLTPLQLRLLGDVSRLVVAELGVQFTVDDPGTRAYLLASGQNIVGITETTRSAVQDALIEGQMNGEGIEQLAKRLLGLPSFDDARGRVVARTELGTSQNYAALTSYRSSGVVSSIRVLDGDYDAACAAIDGRVYPLDAPPPALQHPNCVRAFAPIVDAAELSA